MDVTVNRLGSGGGTPEAQARSALAVPTAFPAPRPLSEVTETFWEIGESAADVTIEVTPPEHALELLERLGPSPFPRGQFPLVGFLATTYEKVGRYALERA